MGVNVTWSLVRKVLPRETRGLSCLQGPIWDVQDVLLALSEPVLRTRGLLGG